MATGAENERGERADSRRDSWQERFGFFWYNDEEIFRDGPAELDGKAAAFAHAGINHVITFSCTHFRWSFRRYWDLIGETLRQVVEACHAHAIRVTEHHSSHLTFNPLSEDDEQYLDRILAVRGSTRSSWPELRADADRDPVIVNGKRLSTFRQIDGRTGQWARSNYRGYCMCFNNPDYRTAYLAYLESLYALGIDGIMTDDVQYFGHGHACACEYCRDRYRQDTGYRLPEPGKEWEQWYGDYRQPSFVSWLEFRFRSVERFHEAVAEHYRSLGLRPCRPNYVSAALTPNPTAYALETLPDLDWIFQENCFSHIIRYSWPLWAVEAAHRFAVGRVRGIPAMSMFYPDRPDSLRFAWSLAQSWGCLYLGTPEGTSLASAERELRDFEQTHRSVLRSPKKLADIAFYDKKRNRDLYEHAATESLPELIGWAQACYQERLPFDILNEAELPGLDSYGVLVLNAVAYLSDEEVAAFARFARAGGVVVWTGATGTRRDDGTPRERPLAAFGIAAGPPVPTARHTVGDGAVLVLPAGQLGVPVERTVTADRWAAQTVRAAYRPPTEGDRQERERLASWLAQLLPNEATLSTTCPESVLVTAFETNAAERPALALHLVNAGGCLSVSGTDGVSHEDPIPFHISWEGEETWEFRVQVPPRLQTAGELCASFSAPDLREPADCAVARDATALVVRVPARLLRWYGLVTVQPGI